MKIGVIGAGNMGTAMVKGFEKAGHMSMKDFFIKSGTSNKAELLAEKVKAQLVNHYDDLSEMEVIILMVNEDAALDVIKQLKKVINSSTLLVSVVPAISIKEMEDVLSETQPIVSLLPNTVVEINQGMIGYHSNSYVDEAMIKALFQPMGKVIKVKESELSIFSTMSGCGPAIVDIFIEALSDGAVLNGMSRAMSYEVITEMIMGAAQLAQQGVHPAKLKDDVTSPGGSTIKAVATLEKNAFRYALIDAINGVQR
ncbi:pyrroline-5-carboxylate reductase [Staphylococcus sp. GSSP0090]|nr:pyrroline-5-carboxylate reductase [Staphylococcus sp. GSSP0090]